MSLLEAISDAILRQNEEETVSLVHKALEEGYPPLEIMNNALIPGIYAVGERFRDGIYFIPEMICGAAAMQKGMDVLRPLIASEPDHFDGKVVIGTIAGDMHDIGKNIVAIMLKSAGFHVFDLGCDVPAKAFVDAAEKNEADLVGISALLSSTMLSIPDVIDELSKRGLRDRVKVIVGGAAVTQTFADRIGADGYAEDAMNAVRVAQDLIK
ncbi:MAG: corrinoid protein [Bacillota bacterium]|jgi:5-methyltetrahydrofolate--homocysteine methyltransferase